MKWVRQRCHDALANTVAGYHQGRGDRLGLRPSGIAAAHKLTAPEQSDALPEGWAAAGTAAHSSESDRTMSNVTFIIGGPGSGKTGEVISRLAARYEADPFSETVVLVPTLRHGDQFRRRLVSRCGVALRLRVETIAQFSWGLAPAAKTPSYILAEELLARTIRREVQYGPAAYFKPIAETEGLGDLLSAAVGNLLAEGIHPQALVEAADRAGIARITALSAIFTAYSSELEQRRWLHPAQAPIAGADAVRAGDPVPGLVVVDGFHLFRGTEAALLEALAERAEVVVAIDPNAGARSQHDYERLLERFPTATVLKLQDRTQTHPLTVTAGAAPDREGQLRAIARQVKPASHRQPRAPPVRLRGRIQAGVALSQPRSAGVR